MATVFSLDVPVFCHFPTNLYALQPSACPAINTQSRPLSRLFFFSLFPTHCFDHLVRAYTAPILTTEFPNRLTLAPLHVSTIPYLTISSSSLHLNSSPASSSHRARHRKFATGPKQTWELLESRVFFPLYSYPHTLYRCDTYIYATELYLDGSGNDLNNLAAANQPAYLPRPL